MRGSLVAALCLLATITAAQWINYEGHKVFRIYPKQKSDATLLQHLREQAILNLDFWEAPNRDGGGVAVHVRPEAEAAFRGILESRDMPYEETISNLQELVDVERQSNEEAKMAAAGSIVGTFATPAEINAWMAELARNSRLATLVSIGKSYEGRDVGLIKISSGGAGKQGVWVDAGIHAREWLSQATLVWMINEMVTKYDTDASIRAMVDKYDWYLLPMVNPDGYEYSHTNDRMWRKTRSHTNLPNCRGADPNRNFDYPVFGGESTSSFPCSDIYKGPHAFSEVEVQNVKTYMESLGGQIHMFIALHAYGQLWFTPWGYADVPRPDDAQEMDRVANIGADALYSVHRTTYKVGTAPELLYAAAGAAEDWAKGTAGVKYAYCFEVRPGQRSMNGFIVQASEIEPSGQEVLAGILAAAGAMK